MEEKYQRLRMLGETYWDVQETRKAMANRIRSSSAISSELNIAITLYKDTETRLASAIRKELRRVAAPPVLAWMKDSPGVGEHLLGRLLGVIGDPYVAYPMRWERKPDGGRVLVADPPYVRNLDKLWAYCGVGDPARRRRRGMTAEDGAGLGNPRAKTIMRVLAVSCLKQPGTRYEQIYRQVRPSYVGRLHERECPQCKGSSGVGQPWRDGHVNGAALRKVEKEILRDLWEAARDAHFA